MMAKLMCLACLYHCHQEGDLMCCDAIYLINPLGPLGNDETGLSPSTGIIF